MYNWTSSLQKSDHSIHEAVYAGIEDWWLKHGVYWCIEAGDGSELELVTTTTIDDAQQQQQQPVFCTSLPGIQHSGPINVVCLSPAPSEQYIVCGSADNTLTVFDRLQNDRQAFLVGHSDQVVYIDLSIFHMFHWLCLSLLWMAVSTNF